MSFPGFFFGAGGPALLFKVFSKSGDWIRTNWLFVFETNSVTMQDDRYTLREPSCTAVTLRITCLGSTYKQMITSDEYVITEKKLRTISERQQIVLPVHSFLKLCLQIFRRYDSDKRPE